MSRILYTVPSHGRPDWMAVTSMVNMIKASRQPIAGDYFAPIPGLLPEVRNRIAHLLLDQDVYKDCEFVVMHDDDLFVQPVKGRHPVLDSWLDIMDQHERIGMIGAVYLRLDKSGATVPTVYLEHQEMEDGSLIFAKWPRVPFFADRIGTGFVMIRRQALMAVRELLGHKRPFLFDLRGSIDELVTEDVFFCDKLREIGWKIAADPELFTRHVKPGKFLDCPPGVRVKVEGMREVTRSVTCLDGIIDNAILLDPYTP